ncbi:MAG: class I SAM-dependent methyltransferase [Candidatus Hydrogenedentes bacterium]|nr:class I SAM-dependent methyltransferase [Candidatus Hydrogenedentota bacterium]
MERDEYAIMFRVEDGHWWYAGLRAMLSRVWDRCAPHGDVRMLDIGCGTGANLSHFRAKAACFGIDFSTEAIRFCRQRSETKTAAASATHLPFADASIDVILSCDVLCHRSIRDKSQPLREIHRVLKPNGIVILNLPAYQWLHSSHDVHVQTDRRFSRGELHALLSASGLGPFYITYWNTLLFPPIVVTRLWRKLRPLPASDLDGASGEGMSTVFGAILLAERALLRVSPLPFGLSVLVAAKKLKEQ